MAYNPNYDRQYMLYNDPIVYAQSGEPLGGALIDIGAPILGTENIAPGRASSTASNANDGSLKGMFRKAKGGADGILNKATNIAENAMFNVKSGKGIAPKYAGLAKGAMGVAAGLKAVKGISDYQNARTDTEELVNDILRSAAGNQNYRYDLSADQLQALRQLQNGTYDLTGDFDMGSVLGNIGNIATGAGLGFITGGGPVGALLGGASGLVDGISSGMVDNQNQITADLEGLYQALYESEMRNKAMKRDAAMQRYANDLY